MRQVMITPGKKLLIDVEPSVHLTGPDSLEAPSPLAPDEYRLPLSVWDLLDALDGFLEDAGSRVVGVEEIDVSAPSAQFVGPGRLVMTTPARRLTLELAETVTVLGPDTLEVDFCGGRTTMTAWELLKYHAADLAAFGEFCGVQIVGVEDDLLS